MENKKQTAPAKPELTRPEQAETETGPELKVTELDQASGGLNIGSQSTGAGAGRVSFNPFSIKRK